MVGTPLYVVAEFDGQGSRLAELTRRIPGATADAIADPIVEVGGERMIPLAVLVQGVPPAQAQAMLDEFKQSGHAVEVISDDRVAERLLLRLHFPLEAAPSVGLQVFERFLGPLHNPWVHMDDGAVYIRGRVALPDQADAIARRLAAELAAAGVEAQVDVQVIDRHDLSVWEDLVEATLGLSR